MQLNLITDRTQADVEFVATLRAKLYAHSATAAELELWNSASLKGSYNTTDLNRVGLAIQYLTEALQDLGLEVSTTPKVDWSENDIPTSAELQRYLADVETLRASIPTPEALPKTPSSLSSFNYIQANNIEAILVHIEMWARMVIEATRYSGDLYSGEI